jgi:hypothetical protein
MRTTVPLAQRIYLPPVAFVAATAHSAVAELVELDTGATRSSANRSHTPHKRFTDTFHDATPKIFLAGHQPPSRRRSGAQDPCRAIEAQSAPTATGEPRSAQRKGSRLIDSPYRVSRADPCPHARRGS